MRRNNRLGRNIRTSGNDLTPNHLAGQNIGVPSDVGAEPERTAFHLRKRGHGLRGLDDNDLKQGRSEFWILILDSEY